MKPQRFTRTKAVIQGGVIAAITAALVFALVAHVMNRPTRLRNVALTAGTQFSITSTVSNSATADTAATLDPGAARFLRYTVHNTLRVPITVDSISITDVTAPSGCAAANLDVSHATFSGSLVVPGKVGTTPGTNTVGVPISLVTNSPVGCKHVTFSFTYSGSAHYTEVYATSTALVSSVNPSNAGQGVTYTATVTAAAGANQDPVPTSPTGAVTFKDGSTTICSSVAVATASTTSATAQCAPPAYSSAGTHAITAVFANTDGNFSTSTSPSLSQVVKSGQTGHTGSATVLTSSTNPSALGSSVTLTAKVTKTSGSGTPTGSVAFFSGSPSGTHTQLGTGALASGKATFSTSSLPAGSTNLYAVYGGDSNFAPSTSAGITQVVVGVPTACTGSFTLKVGDRHFPIVNGTNGNDFIYAVGGGFIVNGLNGNDCLQVGDGNNIITDGSGNNVVLTGNGNSLIVVGHGNNKITVGNGTNGIGVGNGNNTVTLGTGSHNAIVAGKGNNTIYFGRGTYNSFIGGKGHNVCHLPAPPSSWHGSAAAYYHDAITNCTVVTP